MEVFLHCAEGETASQASTFTMSLLFKASSRGLTMGWVGCGWQPLCENKQESGDALIAVLNFHCRTPHVPVSEANSHPALLPQQHRNYHVGVLKTNFLALLKPRDPNSRWETKNHPSTILWAQPHSSPKDNLRLFPLPSFKKNPKHTHPWPTPPTNMKKSKLISTWQCFRLGSFWSVVIVWFVGKDELLTISLFKFNWAKIPRE